MKKGSRNVSHRGGKPKKIRSGPPSEVKLPLKELTALLVWNLPDLDEKTIQEALKKTFTTVEKGYGTIIALRNALKNALHTHQATHMTPEPPHLPLTDEELKERLSS